MKEKRCAPTAMFVTLALLGALLFGVLCGCGAKLDDATVEQAFYDHFGQTDEATGFAYSFAANGKAKIDGKTYYLVDWDVVEVDETSSTARLVPVGFGFLEEDGSSIHTGGYDEQKDRYYIDERTYSYEESATTSK